jgi:transposase-like protein
MVWLATITNRYHGGQESVIGMREVCPACSSERCKKNGHMHTGKQHHQCKQCGRQCVLRAEHRPIGEDQRALVERLLGEKISLHGLCRAVGVSLRWLIDFLGARFLV